MGKEGWGRRCGDGGVVARTNAIGFGVFVFVHMFQQSAKFGPLKRSFESTPPTVSLMSSIQGFQSDHLTFIVVISP